MLLSRCSVYTGVEGTGNPETIKSTGSQEPGTCSKEYFKLLNNLIFINSSEKQHFCILNCIKLGFFPPLDGSLIG